MIKYFCDRCNTPMSEVEYNAAPIMPVYRKVVPQFGEIQYIAQEHITICNRCVDKYNEFIKHEVVIK